MDAISDISIFYISFFFIPFNGNSIVVWDQIPGRQPPFSQNLIITELY